MLKGRHIAVMGSLLSRGDVRGSFMNRNKFMIEHCISCCLAVPVRGQWVADGRAPPGGAPCENE